MDFNRADKELTKLFHKRVADPTFPELMRRTVVLFNACRFYAQLVEQGREPEYFGTEVWAEDTDCVLIRWRLDEKHLRVVYADLRVETVPAHEEARGRCLAPPGRRRPELPPDQAADVTRSWGATFPW